MTIQPETREDFKKVVYKFFREHDDVKSREMSELLKSAYMNFAETDEIRDKGLSGHPDITAEERAGFRKMWEGFVQQVIDYMKEHPHVCEVVSKRQQEITAEWNKNLPENLQGHMMPDVRVYFGVDGLDESISAGEWVAATDSYISLCVGKNNIIEMM